MNKRNANLDLIKCVACISVVGLHAVGMANYTIYYLCDCGVPLFFMVNGYLMLSREKIDYSYVFRKILHILKVVVLWNLVITVPVFLFRHKLVNPLHLSFESLLQKGYLWHFWFFGALIIIYLLLPLLHGFLGGKALHHKIVCLVLMCVCLVMNTLSMMKGYPLHMFIPQPLRLWTWLFYFLMGGLFSYISPQTHQLPASFHGLLLILFTVINNVAEKRIGLYLINSRLAEYFYDDLTSILWYTLLFTFLLRIPLKNSLAAAVSRFSSLTMGIFIVHPILLALLHTIYIPAGIFSVLLFWMLITFISLAITFVISKIPVVKHLVKL